MVDETRTLDQMPLLSAVSPDARMLVSEPGGVQGAVPVKALLGKLISTDTAAVTAAALAADLGHEPNAISLVYADPDLLKNGWYRKEGATGAGQWRQFETLSKATRDSLLTLAGNGPPSALLGVDGQFYRDLQNGDEYGPKAGGEWGGARSIIGPAGADANSYANLDLLKAAQPNGLTYMLRTAGGPIAYAFVAGDFTGRADDVNVVALDAVDVTAGALVRQSVAALAATDGLGGAARSAIDAYAQVLRLTQFGYKGDGVTDDTAAWRNAIAYAGVHNVRQIVVPRGISIVTGSIVDAANPLPRGLTFVGEAPCDSQYAQQSVLRYTGAGVCWNVNYPVGGPAAIGRWRWADISFQATNQAGTMFSFNDPVTYSPIDDSDAPMFIQSVMFQNIMANGCNGTGDFIRAAKTFELQIDAASAIYSWRRGVWLKGCDNCRIEARLNGNNRNVMVERSGVFGNNNMIAARYLGSTDQAFGGEAAYSVYDSAFKTTIGPGTLFEGSAVVAHLFLDGYATDIMSPQLGGASPFFRLAPNGREIAMHSPRVSSYNGAWAPIIDVPASWAFGAAQTDHRMTIIDAPVNMQRTLGAANQRGRLRTLASPLMGQGLDQAGEVTVAAAAGFLSSVTCRAGNGSFWSYGGIGGQPIGGIVQDPLATGGYSIELSATSGSGLGLLYTIGRSVMPAKYAVAIRSRIAEAITTGAFIYIATKNGAFAQTLTLNLASSFGRPAPDVLDLTGWSTGDVLGIELFNSGTGLKAWIDYLSLRPAD